MTEQRCSRMLPGVWGVSLKHLSFQTPKWEAGVENASGLSALLCLYHSHARVKSQDNQGSACRNGGPKSDVEGVGSQIMVSRSEGEFRLGRPSASEGVADKAAQDVTFATFCYQCLRRHADGDWGNISVGGKARNERAIKEGSCILSAYTRKGWPKIWIITEADRSATRILFPHEYREESC
jgi:hypothetical protein